MRPMQCNQEKINELIAWMQEYANLCTVLSICPANNKEVHTNIRKLLEGSIKQGNCIINQYVNNTNREVISTPGKSRPFIPLSGMPRLNENFDYTNNMTKTVPPITNNIQFLPSSDLKPSKNYSQKKNAS